MLPKVTKFDAVAMGVLGGKVVGTGTYTGVYCAIKALEDIVITATGNISDLEDVTVLGGDHVPGVFTSVTVTSGNAILYYGEGS